MNKAQELTQKIADITRIIEEQYPELYRILDEEPVDEDLDDPTKIDDADLEAYFLSLQELLKNHIKNLNTN
jgi:protein-tyrosine-phosphatase